MSCIFFFPRLDYAPDDDVNRHMIREAKRSDRYRDTAWPIPRRVEQLRGRSQRIRRRLIGRASR